MEEKYLICMCEHENNVVPKKRQRESPYVAYESDCVRAKCKGILGMNAIVEDANANGPVLFIVPCEVFLFVLLLVLAFCHRYVPLEAVIV
jgi:hypothetical protein